MLVERDRLLIEPRLRIGRRVLAIGDADASEVLARHTELVHVPPREHRDPRRGRDETEWEVPAVLHLRRVTVGASEPEAEAFIEGAVAHDDPSGAGLDGHRRLMNRGARRAAAVMD